MLIMILPRDETMNEKPSFRVRLRQVNAVDLVILLAVAYCFAFWSALVSNPDTEIVRYIFERTGFTGQAQQAVFATAGITVFVLYFLTGDATTALAALLPGGVYTLLLAWHSLTRDAAETSTYAVTALFMWMFLFVAILIAGRYQELQARIKQLIIDKAANEGTNG